MKFWSRVLGRNYQFPSVDVRAVQPGGDAIYLIFLKRHDTCAGRQPTQYQDFLMKMRKKYNFAARVPEKISLYFLPTGTEEIHHVRPLKKVKRCHLRA